MSKETTELKKLIINADEVFQGIYSRPDSKPLYLEALKLAKILKTEIEEYYVRSKLFLIDGDPQNALECLTKVTELKPDCWKGWHYKGFAYENLGEYEKALECYDHAIKLNSNSSLSWYNKGIAFAKMEDYEKSIQSYNEALKIDPKNVRALNNKGIILSNFNELESALECLTKATDIDSDYLHAWDTLGTILNKMNRYEEALKNFDRALEIEQNVKIMGNKAKTLCDLERYEECLNIANEIVQLKSNFADGWNTKGVALSKQHKFEKALDQFKKANSIDPENELYISNIKLIESILSSSDEKKKIETSDLPPDDKEEKILEIDIRNSVIDLLMGKYEKIFSAKRDYDKRLDDLLKPVNQEENNFLMVLRRWNSYTPTMITDTDSNLGGGYFIYWKGKGIVIDPGFDFLENLFNNHLKISHINAVVITHAHIDHCVDFESILTLIYEYNDRRENDASPKKRIDVYANLGALKKFLGWIHLNEPVESSQINRIIPLERGMQYDLEDYDIKLTATTAEHPEVLSKDYAIGLILDLCNNMEPILKIGYTSDTKWSKNVVQQYESVDVIVAHLGSINEDDFKSDDEKEGIKENHLMLTGVISTIYKSKAKLAIVSEFGEELGVHRLDLVKAINSVFSKHGCRCLTGDVGLMVDLPDLKIRCCDCSNLVNYEDIVERIRAKKLSEKRIEYICPNCLK